MLHTRAHSASAETAESCGTTLSVVGTVLLPCAQITLTAHGNPTATHHAHRKSPSFQQKPVPTPQRPQSPMCSIDNNHAHQAPPRRRPTNPPQTRAGTRPISTRTTTDLAAKMYRSRRGSGPISARVTTDLAAEHDRLNGGERGIRTPGAPGAQRFSRPPHSAALSSLHARQPLEPLDARAGDPTLPPPPRCATPWPTRAIRFSRLNRLSRINGIDRADRRHPREKNPRLRVGLADAGTGEAGLSRRPSAKACAIAGHTGRRGMSVACRAW